MKNPNNTICVAAVGSLTLSLKAKRLLQEAEVAVEVVPLLREETKQGCAYGVSFLCREKSRVKTVLTAGRISPTQYIERRGPS